MAVETALDRVKRILELIPYLHGRSEKISELASDFEVPAEIITRDLEIAFMSGMPGYTPDLLIEVALESDLASVQEPQSLDLPPSMEVGQIVVLFLGIKTLLSFIDSPDPSREVAEKLLRRIDTILKDDQVTAVEMEVSEKEKVILRSIHREESLLFDYLPLTGVRASSRLVRPIEIYWRSGQPLLRAYDIEAKGVRNFFLTRMSEIRSDQSFEDVDRHLSSNPEEPMLIQAVLSRDAHWWTKRYAAFITEIDLDSEEGSISLTMEYWDEIWLVRTLASISDLVLSVRGILELDAKIREYLEIAV
ncbi:MAG: WYL domain-containing protein [Actinobacteria bacterium]|nr:WYL domain-containing protein [Actinomycetota bacterium]